MDDLPSSSRTLSPLLLFQSAWKRHLKLTGAGGESAMSDSRSHTGRLALGGQVGLGDFADLLSGQGSGQFAGARGDALGLATRNVVSSLDAVAVKDHVSAPGDHADRKREDLPAREPVRPSDDEPEDRDDVPLFVRSDSPHEGRNLKRLDEDQPRESPPVSTSDHKALSLRSDEDVVTGSLDIQVSRGDSSDTQTENARDDVASLSPAEVGKSSADPQVRLEPVRVLAPEGLGNGIPAKEAQSLDAILADQGIDEGLKKAITHLLQTLSRADQERLAEVLAPLLKGLEHGRDSKASAEGDPLLSGTHTLTPDDHQLLGALVAVLIQAQRQTQDAGDTPVLAPAPEKPVAPAVRDLPVSGDDKTTANDRSAGVETRPQSTLAQDLAVLLTRWLTSQAGHLEARDASIGKAGAQGQDALPAQAAPKTVTEFRALLAAFDVSDDRLPDWLIRLLQAIPQDRAAARSALSHAGEAAAAPSNRESGSASVPAAQTSGTVAVDPSVKEAVRDPLQRGSSVSDAGSKTSLKQTAAATQTQQAYRQDAFLGHLVRSIALPSHQVAALDAPLSLGRQISENLQITLIDSGRATRQDPGSSSGGSSKNGASSDELSVLLNRALLRHAAARAAAHQGQGGGMRDGGMRDIRLFDSGGSRLEWLSTGSARGGDSSIPLFAQLVREGGRGAAQPSQGQDANQQKPATQGSPSDQVFVNIRRAVARGQSRIDVRMHPAELGRVRLQIAIESAGKMVVRVFSDREETDRLLRTDSRSLISALRGSGFDLEDRNLHFSLEEERTSGDNGKKGGRSSSRLEVEAAALEDHESGEPVGRTAGEGDRSVADVDERMDPAQDQEAGRVDVLA